MLEALLEACDLTKYFPLTRGVGLRRIIGWVRAVDGISFAVRPKETFGLVGESGCGKTTTARLILRLERPSGGSLRFEGQEVQGLTGEALRRYRASVQVVFQDPYSSLNPRLRVGTLVGEPVVVNRLRPRAAIEARVKELLTLVGLDPAYARLFPHELSGGQRQRVAMARALALDPRLVVLDEPVSALDVSVRAQILNMLKDLQVQRGLTYFLISHDLATVGYLCTTVAVMYSGKIVEMAPVQSLFSASQHPYTRALLSAALPPDPEAPREEIVLAGEVPSAIHVPPGCRFHLRCPYAMPICAQAEPKLKAMGNNHQVACHLYS